MTKEKAEQMAWIEGTIRNKLSGAALSAIFPGGATLTRESFVEIAGECYDTISVRLGLRADVYENESTMTVVKVNPPTPAPAGESGPPPDLPAPTSDGDG